MAVCGRRVVGSGDLGCCWGFCWGGRVERGVVMAGNWVIVYNCGRMLFMKRDG